MKKSSVVIGVMIACMGLTSCVTYDPMTGEKELNKTTQGGIAGAALGGILGAAVSKEDRMKGALIGAGIGGLAGGSVGYYMDRQENKLRQKMAGTGVTVTRDGDNIILNMPGNITFPTGLAELNPDFTRTLDGVATVLEEYESTLITIDGYTDSVGSESYNQTLSEKRAMSVATYLAGKGIQTARLAARGFGESNPVATNATAEGRAQNRRVELTLEPITK
ncbi:OmpA family protein [Gynuella sunshinyii]|uniref:Outer membrane protein and related peptidoglycan-associated (Lipo)protein n=1 Tax=Gynuella sunshinyii YC6258 TaxID=1445510 RepID=A0A0C5VGE6_9GAMM|nr:OmpA family protein [Gynuella sunshinyii]AJQ92488.1 outer membrane protein and related peptidoglycan-associated (lipo)protein [Gynuella sunshinyii YC6258]